MNGTIVFKWILIWVASSYSNFNYTPNIHEFKDKQDCEAVGNAMVELRKQSRLVYSCIRVER